MRDVTSGLVPSRCPCTSTSRTVGVAALMIGALWGCASPQLSDSFRLLQIPSRRLRHRSRASSKVLPPHRFRCVVQNKRKRERSVADQFPCAGSEVYHMPSVRGG